MYWWREGANSHQIEIPPPPNPVEKRVVDLKLKEFPVITARKRSLRRLCFYRCLSFILFTGGAFVVLFGGGMHGFIWGGMRGFIWGGVHGFIQGGMRGFIRGDVRGFIWGVCMVLFGGACMVLFGGACVVLFGGACVVLFGGACVVLFGGCAWFYSGGMHSFIWGCAWFYSGGHAWFYSGGACVVFSVFSDTMRYGQWAGGTHPTGMHSCFLNGKPERVRGASGDKENIITSRCFGDMRTSGGPIVSLFYSLFQVFWRHAYIRRSYCLVVLLSVPGVLKTCVHQEVLLSHCSTLCSRLSRLLSSLCVTWGSG